MRSLSYLRKAVLAYLKHCYKRGSISLNLCPDDSWQGREPCHSLGSFCGRRPSAAGLGSREARVPERDSTAALFYPLIRPWSRAQALKSRGPEFQSCLPLITFTGFLWREPFIEFLGYKLWTKYLFLRKRRYNFITPSAVYSPNLRKKWNDC